MLQITQKPQQALVLVKVFGNRARQWKKCTMYVSVEPEQDLKIIGDKPRKLIVEKPDKMDKNQNV